MTKIRKPSDGGDEAPSRRCALCGHPLVRPDQVRTLGVPPVVLTVCADTDGCAARYANAPARTPPAG